MFFCCFVTKFDSENESPNTPKRYSCTSEYATPKGSDDSDSSLYYSFALSEDDVCKENSINGGQWSVSNSPSRIPRTKTPLLRKVLQPNYTPRNKNNKRVSFSHLAKPDPKSDPNSGKIPKLLSQSGTLAKADLNPSSTYDMKLIEENLPPISNENPANTLEQNTVTEAVTMNDSSSDVTDDLENDLHDTIIENPSSIKPNHSSNEAGEEQTASVEQRQQNAEPSLEKNKTNDLSQVPTDPNQLIQSSVSQCSVSDALKGKTDTKKTVEDILRNVIKKAPPQTRNSAKVNRQRLANANQNTILPGVKRTIRATTYKRRSSTYEPRKVDPRKSLSALKNAVSKVTKSFTGRVIIIDVFYVIT